MCQLTYSNLHEPYLNSLMIYILGRVGSKKHDDGTGFICPDNKIWKSEFAAESITNLGRIIDKHVINDRAIPFHIRSATWGIEVSKENSHPFDGKHFILMHNGTLLPRNGEETKDKKHDSDSLKFLNTLDECKDISPQGTFEEIFNAAMNNFAGKFAFIIRDKETNNDYVVRGKTAELWISTLRHNGIDKGYVINTSKETMKESFKDFVNIWELLFQEVCEFSEPVLLEQESIFLANATEITKIGKAIEVEPKKENKTALLPRGRSYNNYWGDNYENNDDVKSILEKARKIYNFLSDHSMGLLDFQLMVMISGGVSILELTEEDLTMFVDYLIPKISANKKIKEEVKRILRGKYFPNEVYENKLYNLEYPWTVNDGNTVIKALKEYVKEI